MPSRKSYNRFFIILQEDQKGYGLDSNRTPSGYAKLEMRNDRAKTSFYVQDIKKQNGPYYMVLIAQGNGGNRELINLGQINIDEGGKADICNEHDVNNIGSTNIGMDKIQGAGICRINGAKVNPVMAGFICGEELNNWTTYPMARSIVRNDNKSKINEVSTKNQENIIETKRAEVMEQKKSEEVEVKKGNYNKEENLQVQSKVEEMKVEIESRKDDSNTNNLVNYNSEVDTQDFDEYEDQIERLKEYRKKHSKKNCYDDEDEDKKKHHKDDDHDCDDKKYHKNDDNKKDVKKVDKGDNPIGPMGDFFKTVVKGLEKIGNKDSIKNCFWYKAHVENLEAMYCVYDYNKYSVVFYPMICYYPYIAKAKSFMVGYKCDDNGVLKYIIYAIPGTKALVDQPYEGKTGFVTFMSETEDSEMGHWLMYYDIKKNSVVIPVKTNK